MACAATIKTGDNVDGEAKQVVLGSALRVAVNTYQQQTNATLEACEGCLDRSSLVVPPTLTLSNPVISIFFYPDSTTPVATGTPSITNLVDSDMVIVGYRVSYVFDTGSSPLDIAGRYMLVFGWACSDGTAERYVLYLTVVEPDWLEC